MSTEAFSALNRLGLGARPGDVSEIGADPRGWVLAQIKPGALKIKPPKTGLTRERVTAVLEDMPKGTEDVWGYIRDRIDPKSKMWTAEREALMRHQARTDTPFAERWVGFWSNHLTVSGTQLAEAYDRDVIRTHAFGNIRDLLHASATHHAMLNYLDNARSFGPNSHIGQWGYGLNENYARELMELHTLGVNGGYTLTDIIELAKILTGWTIDWTPNARRSYGEYFRTEGHEPGAKKLLGKKIRESGRRELDKALDVLVTQPATAEFLATKIARHFVSDKPPRKLVRHLADVFQKRDGDLAAMARALVKHNATWDPDAAKFKTPHDFMVSLVRGIGPDRFKADSIFDDRFYGVTREMGQGLWSAPQPIGWPDTTSDWNHANTLMQRAEVARWLSYYVERKINVPRLARRLLGDRIDRKVRRAIKQAEWQPGLSLLFASPDFQWRR